MHLNSVQGFFWVRRRLDLNWDLNFKFNRLGKRKWGVLCKRRLVLERRKEARMNRLN
jgi:hypothetical protein